MFTVIDDKLLVKLYIKIKLEKFQFILKRLHSQLAAKLRKRTFSLNFVDNKKQYDKMPHYHFFTHDPNFHAHMCY